MVHLGIIPIPDVIIEVAATTIDSVFLLNEENNVKCLMIDGKFHNILDDFIQISSGHTHTLFLNRNGEVYSYGSNEYGQLGIINDAINISNPILIPITKNIIQISAGANHSLLLDNKGLVYSFGLGTYGRLGLGDNENRYIPTLIDGLSNISQISAGNCYSLALTKEGNIYFFGFPVVGKSEKLPVLICGINNIIKISSSKGKRQYDKWMSGHSLLLNNEGKVYSFGTNDHGQLGLGHKLNVAVPTLIYHVGKIIDICAGGEHSLIKNIQGSIYSFGSNECGQLLKYSLQYRTTDRNIPIRVIDEPLRYQELEFKDH
jgi:alpha-tubulin suppressor-like RCC1 family protein